MIKVKNKKAFSMVTAIFVIIIMATVSSLIMNVTGKTVKETTQLYQKEQAQLLARSYTELAILNVLKNNRLTGGICYTGGDYTFGNVAGTNGYKINIRVTYIGNDDALGFCKTSANAVHIFNNGSAFAQTISMVIDTYITYKDFDDPSAALGNGNRNITFHRRTVQKL